MTKILIPRTDTISAKVIEPSDWEEYFGEPQFYDFIRSGFGVSAASGLSVDVAIGEARVLGHHIGNTAIENVGSLTDDTINYLYIQITRDTGEAESWDFFKNTVGGVVADSFLIAKITTASGVVTAVDQTNETLTSDHNVFGFVGTGAQIAALTKTYAGMKVLCLVSGSGFSKNQKYTRNVENDAWVRDAVAGQSGDQIYKLSTTIGDYSDPSSAVASSEFTESGTGANNGFEASHATGFGSIVFAQVFNVGIGALVTSVGVRVFAAAGNIRVKVYDADGAGGDAGTLLGESGSTSIPGTGYQTFAVTASETTTGNVYVAFEIDDSASLDLYYTSGQTRHFTGHTYGAGPDPFGTATKTSGNQPYLSLLYTPKRADGSAVDDDTATYWRSDSENNPNIYIDTGSAQEIIGLAIHLDRTLIDETEIKIRVSTDATFSDAETVRIINISDFTDDTWRFIVIPRLPENRRYVQIYGTGSSKTLAINEIKYRAKATADIDREHYHNYLDPTKVEDSYLDSD